MRDRTPMRARQPMRTSTPLASGVLRRKCACGQHTEAGGECTECGKNRQTLQRATRKSEFGTHDSAGVPPIVDDVLRSPGRQLDSETREFFEKRFRHDFSKVRVHADAPAAKSAQAVDALAYTVGRDIVFGAAQYAPGTKAGRQLLAHELTHTIQQSNATAAASQLRIGEPSDSLEHAADRMAHQISGESEHSHANNATRTRSDAPMLQRQPAFGKTDSKNDLSENPRLVASLMGSLTLDKFEFNKAILTKDQTAMLAAHARQIKMLLDQYPDSFISVAGHTDAVGTEDNNQELGQQRADAVLAELAADGLPTEIMRASSLGETALAVRTKNAEPRNRRVEIFFRARNFNRPRLDFGELKAPALDITGEKAPEKFSLSMRDPNIPGEKWTPAQMPKLSGPFPQTSQKNPLDMTQKGGEKPMSANDMLFKRADELINPYIKKLPGRVQDFIRDAAHSGIEKLESAIMSKALDQTSLDKNTKDSMLKIFESILAYKLKF